MDFKKLAMDTAALSPCAKRKVGAVIVNKFGEVLSTGFNYNTSVTGPGNCEDVTGVTYDTVTHAEISAIAGLNYEADLDKAKIYVTHQPCTNCAKAVNDLGLEVVIVENFMKFDTGKLRYNLIPPIVLEELAKVLTYGAKKYKPNNWKNVDDQERYIDATFRHFEAWRAGEKFDAESKLSHLSHVLTNIAFLIYLEDIK